ncbi:MAG: phosphomannomutase/phosphoglucomutase [Alphaproteobacteria bacterium]|nr:phosphomannomutase/phosphoglucomutase [Alphaproteobacteria bacterium]
MAHPKPTEIDPRAPKPNSESFERDIWVKEAGFREYDARWLYPEQINLRGIQSLGMALGSMVKSRYSDKPSIVVGHDYRAYSAHIKMALITGLMAAGCDVKDIGLALSPVAYFAQFALDCLSVAMVTASHNENGWTGVKMGMERPLTFGPELMSELKERTINQNWTLCGGGSYEVIEGMKDRYLDDLTRNVKLAHRLKVVAACGNGTAGAYAPEALRRIGCEVIELDCDLDHSFPHYNPNPEDMEMLHVLSRKVKETGADVGLAFDGDGDRCGVVDNTGEEIFADKMGVILARDLAAQYPGADFPHAQFVADVKSTGLFASDPVLKSFGAKTDYWKTGHSYLKRRVNELGALAGFEKSGHYFFNAPIGKGYDDGVLSAITVCRLLDRHPGQSLADLKNALPKTWGSPTMAPFCPDDKKYRVVERVTAHYQSLYDRGEKILGQSIENVVTVNGVRVTLADGTWGLIRASSNVPSLVVVVESPVSEAQTRAMFAELDATLSQFPEVGEYNQKF